MKKLKVIFTTLCLLLVVTTIVQPTAVVRADPDPQNKDQNQPPPPPPPSVDWATVLALMSLIHL